MQSGVVLGIFGIISLYMFKCSFTYPFCSTLFTIMLLTSPMIALFQTIQFRNNVFEEASNFTLTQGFLYSLLTGFYASVWVALGIFVYLQYFDHGSIFAAYAQSVNTPEMQQYLAQTGLDAEFNTLTGGKGTQGLAETMQNIGAATYSAMSLYFAIIFGPVISLIIGLITRRK